VICTEKLDERGVLLMDSKVKNNNNAKNLSSEKKHEHLEVLNYFYQDRDLRHHHFWDLLYKSILSIITLMSIPYFLEKNNDLTELLFLFPLTSMLLCIVSYIIRLL
jgi:hypothetical protein